jgi:transposase
MAVMPIKYSDEFKRDSVALVLEQGISQRQVRHDMGVSKSALQVWVRGAEL